MKLDDAVKHAAKAVDSLSGEQAAAVYALVELGKRVLRGRRAIRDLAEIVAPESHANQTQMFAPPDDGG